MSSYLNDMYSALQYLATNPETNANRSEVISVATDVRMSCATSLAMRRTCGRKLNKK